MEGLFRTRKTFLSSPSEPLEQPNWCITDPTEGVRVALQCMAKTAVALTIATLRRVSNGALNWNCAMKEAMDCE